MANLGVLVPPHQQMASGSAARVAATASRLPLDYPSSLPRCDVSSLPSPVGSTFATDLSSPILEEEAGDFSETSSPNEPATPVSRHSQDFVLGGQADDALLHHDQQQQHLSANTPPSGPFKDNRGNGNDNLSIDSSHLTRSLSLSTDDNNTLRAVPTAEDLPEAPPRRPSRSASGAFKRTMSNVTNMFRRTSSATSVATEPSGTAVLDSATATGTNTPDGATTPSHRSSGLRWPSRRGSAVVARSSSPPSDGDGAHCAENGPIADASTAVADSSAATASASASATATDTADANGDATANANADHFKFKGRVSTGLTFRAALGAKEKSHHSTSSSRLRRANSLEALDQSSSGREKISPKEEDPQAVLPDRSPWAFPPEAGTGLKARRMSLSLPDDFTVDVVELTKEFGYHNKILGRHGRHLGKGATSKVNIMERKKCSDELFAVKEFRGKSRRETQEEYEKKVKSEYSIAKSLHHPNIVETFRLCSHHGRWNHVMEYCSEGDLFALVQKGWLKGESRQSDRLCLFKQLIQGVGYLHANGIAHRDIKLENLLLTKDSKLKITDFGVSEVFSGIHPGLREAGGQCGVAMGEVRLCAPGICGSEPYIAPEVIAKQQRYDPRPLDVWSSAIIMIYLVFGGGLWARADTADARYAPFAKSWRVFNEKQQQQQEEEPEATSSSSSSTNVESTDDRPIGGITDTDYPIYFPFDRVVKPPALRRVLLQMLNPNPQDRISILDVLNNRWVKNIECCQLENYDEPRPIDASKPKSSASKRIYYHNHLPPHSGGIHI